MHRLLISLIIPLATLQNSAWAVDTRVRSTTDEYRTSSTISESQVTRGYLQYEVVGIKPQIGAVMYKDQFGNNTARAAIGLTIDMNLATTINDSWSYLYIGPSTGVLFSHLGEPTSNFFGANADKGVDSGGANMGIIPVNLKVGYNITDNFRVGVHGGGNVIYRSVPSVMYLGQSSFDPAPSWKIFPNFGLDVDLGLGGRAALFLRPDLTITPGDNIFTGTVAINIPLD